MKLPALFLATYQALIMGMAYVDSVVAFLAPANWHWPATLEISSQERATITDQGRGASRSVVGVRPRTELMAGFGSKSDNVRPSASGAGRGEKAFQRQMRSFVGLKDASADIVDVYVNQPQGGDDKFIFAGKVARSHNVSVQQALQWQRDLILDHTRLLERSLRDPLRVFTAPGNTEVEVARNLRDLTWVLGGKGNVDTNGMRSEEVGFMPEMYEDGEAYFYTRKLKDGKCPAPPSEVTIKTVDDMMAGTTPSTITPTTASSARE